MISNTVKDSMQDYLKVPQVTHLRIMKFAFLFLATWYLQLHLMYI